MSGDLDLLLVTVGETRKKIYQDLSKDFSAVEPPFWAALTAGFIRERGYSVDILDANVEMLSNTETAEIVIKRKPGLTAVVVYGQQANTCTPLMTSVGELCREIKKSDKRINLILTGWHPSALPQRTMEEEGCDFVAEGEGFYTLLGLLEKRNINDVPGLWWRENGEIRNNPRAENIKNLTSELSAVAWDLLPMDSGNYRAFNWVALSDLQSRTKCASMYTSLGCPYQCSFCAIHATYKERKMRFWETDWVLNQIDGLVKKYGVKHINIMDEFFVFKPQHYMPIVEGLIERDYGLNLCAFARVDNIREEYLGKLKKAGFNWFKLGIESGRTDILKRASKGKYDKEDIREVVKATRDAGISLCANFIFGLPGDSYESMQETLNLAFELNCEFPSFFAAMAPPGSDLFYEAQRKGIALPCDKGGPGWIGYAQQGYHFMPLPTEHLSAAEVLAFRDYAFDAYFKNPGYLSMIKNRFGPDARKHVEAMTKLKLKRKLLGD
ncbi:MAG: radical SAM protein [Nitrospiraceae bacterium]|nr:MAG: radical SAM protein [Nitrospiraceae bacterium]